MSEDRQFSEGNYPYSRDSRGDRGDRGDRGEKRGDRGDREERDEREERGESGYDIDKDRRMFSRKKSCWFCAKKSEPDWKDTFSYNWLINEFGKISPSRITGLCATHQRTSTSAIKRGRNFGLISHISNRVAY